MVVPLRTKRGETPPQIQFLENQSFSTLVLTTTVTSWHLFPGTRRGKGTGASGHESAPSFEMEHIMQKANYILFQPPQLIIHPETSCLGRSWGCETARRLEMTFE
ncbi:hypothetical protein TNIN_236651 [Trichonephila inaurata madagascariensis]|uniref:Uncharacterized protein n=1 Tax=Trichonephila inaurata madagascariensis TaxID=2747483 RepID=A0A8X7BN63_9ARAC|nr:hypothetical protein TNIN_236651 [Trichonephila inaurata madagascariensis]